MAANVLTDRSLKSELILAQAEAKQKNTRIKIRDGNNLMLIVRENGEASWVFEYRRGKQRPLHTIGPWPTVTLSKARELADKARVLIADGKDPNTVKTAAKEAVVKAERHGVHTVKFLFDEWLGKMDITPVYRGNIEAAFVKDVLPVIGYKHPSEVTGKDVNEILRTIEARGALVVLTRVKMWMSQMFDYAVDHEGYDIDTNPCPSGRKNKSFQTRKGGHFPAIINPDQAAEMLKKIVARQNTITKACLIFTAHTFQRPTETRLATWKEFDLENAKWTIPAERMKKRREHWVPLSPFIVDFLKKHQGVVGDDPESFLFPGRDEGHAISEATPNKMLNDLGYLKVHCPHGFRAMARTIMAERIKVDERFIEKQLSHEPKDLMDGAYNRSEFWDDRVVMMDTWSKWVKNASQ